MNAKELQAAMDNLSRKGQWLFTVKNIKTLFPRQSDIVIMKSLKRHTESGLLMRVCRGLYANDRASCKPGDALESLIAMLRPIDLSYLSAETVLSEAGVISQMPNALIVMTTGRSRVYRTSFGIIEFIHTKKSRQDLLSQVDWNSARGVYQAGVALAYRDLKSLRRNLDLVDHDELMDVLREKSAHENEPA